MTERQMSDLVHHQNPLTLPPSASVQEACRNMAERRVGAVLVVGPDRALLGIFTGRDAVGRICAEGRDPRRTTLGEVMTPNPITTAPKCTAIDCLRLMRDCGCRHLPIVRGERLVGVVSHGDFRGIEHDRLEQETRLWERL
jgi:CBS domain-containing protein